MTGVAGPRERVERAWALSLETRRDLNRRRGQPGAHPARYLYELGCGHHVLRTMAPGLVAACGHCERRW